MAFSSDIRITIANTHPRIRLPRSPISDAVERTLRGEGIATAEVTVILVSDEELLDLNRRFLDHDYLTDVITFVLEDSPLEGEIYISVDRARQQADEYGVGLSREIRRLAVHGVLHLAGYDDRTDSQRRRMTQLEDRYLGIELADR